MLQGVVGGLRQGLSCEVVSFSILLGVDTLSSARLCADDISISTLHRTMDPQPCYDGDYGFEKKSICFSWYPSDNPASTPIHPSHMLRGYSNHARNPSSFSLTSLPSPASRRNWSVGGDHRRLVEAAGLGPTVHEALAGGAAPEKTRMTPGPYACEHRRLAAHHRFSHPPSSRYASPSLESPSTFLPTTTRQRTRLPARRPLACLSSHFISRRTPPLSLPCHTLPDPRTPALAVPSPANSKSRWLKHASNSKSSCSIFCPLRRCFHQHRRGPGDFFLSPTQSPSSS